MKNANKIVEGKWCEAAGVRAAHLASIVIVLLVCLGIGSAAFAETAERTTRDILRQAAIYQNQFRTGQMDIIPAYVGMLEEATLAEPGNAELSYALGVAYFTQAAGVALASGNPADAFAPYQKGTAALDHALQLDPDHPEALAIRAGTRLMLASFARKPEVVAQLTERALAEMNRAVAIAPDSKRARLQRAFSGLTLPLELRNHEQEVEDLEFLVREAGRSRAGDYTKLLRADLEFELGRLDQARAFYRQVERANSPAADMAVARLAAMDQGGVAFEDIKALRAAAGAQCVMCHGD